MNYHPLYLITARNKYFEDRYESKNAFDLFITHMLINIYHRSIACYAKILKRFCNEILRPNTKLLVDDEI